MFLKSLLCMTLRPEYFPYRSPLFYHGINELFYVTFHIFNIERECHYEPSILSFFSIYWCEQHLWKIFYFINNNMGIAMPHWHIPIIHPFQFGHTYNRLHLSHAVIPTYHIMYIWQFLF